MKQRILLVDDEPSILATLGAILALHGYEVVTASSAKEGIDKLRNSVFELVITDLKMEHSKSGYEVLTAAKLAQPCPILTILTASPNAGRNGVDAVFEKPTDIREVLDRLKLLLSQTRGTSDTRSKREQLRDCRVRIRRK
jgi:DNA-binding response OmpR family regulator